MATPLKADDGKSNVPDSVILECQAEYTELRSEQQRIAQRIGTMLKRYENQGVVPKHIKNAYKFAVMERDIARQNYQTFTRYLRVAQIIPVTWDAAGQGDFTTAMAAEASATPAPASGAAKKLLTARAYNDGYNSGLHGAALDSSPFGHMPGSDEFVAWRDGRGDGAADRQARQEVSGKRGRPKKAKGDGADKTAADEGAEKQATPRKRGKKNDALNGQEVAGHA